MTTLTVQPSIKDAEVNSGSPDTNFGANTYIKIKDQTGGISRSCLEFDISALPAGVLITSASLQLYYYENVYTDPVGKTVWAYKLSRTDWVEAEATWNIYKTGSNWTAAGGDYVTSSPAGGSTTFPASYDWMTWDVLAIVQDAYSAGKSAEFLVKLETEGLATGYSVANLRSKEYAVDTTLRPKLVIVYTLPVAGAKDSKSLLVLDLI